MHKNAAKCNETLSKWCKNKHGASKIMDTFETYQGTITVQGSFEVSNTCDKEFNRLAQNLRHDSRIRKAER
jgi:hypothetical protein